MAKVFRYCIRCRELKRPGWSPFDKLCSNCRQVYRQELNGKRDPNQESVDRELRHSAAKEE